MFGLYSECAHLNFGPETMDEMCGESGCIARMGDIYLTFLECEGAQPDLTFAQLQRLQEINVLVLQSEVQCSKNGNNEYCIPIIEEHITDDFDNLTNAEKCTVIEAGGCCFGTYIETTLKIGGETAAEIEADLQEWGCEYPEECFPVEVEDKPTLRSTVAITGFSYAYYQSHRTVVDNAIVADLSQLLQVSPLKISIDEVSGDGGLVVTFSIEFDESKDMDATARTLREHIQDETLTFPALEALVSADPEAADGDAGIGVDGSRTQVTEDLPSLSGAVGVGPAVLSVAASLAVLAFRV
jgi:hypothetical protein